MNINILIWLFHLRLWRITVPRYLQDLKSLLKFDSYLSQLFKSSPDLNIHFTHKLFKFEPLELTV